MDQISKQKRKKKKLMIAGVILLCLCAVYVCTIIGISSVSFKDANRILANRLLHIPMDMSGIRPADISIIMDIRLPRVIMAFIAGGSLAICGAGFQGIFKNPMADPFILGVSSGAALGASIGIVLHFTGGFAGMSGSALLAFAGAFAAILLVYTISRMGRRVPVATLLLSGIAVSQTLSAVMSIVMLLNRQSMDKIMFWTMGSLNGKGWGQILMVLPYVIVGAIVLLLSARDLDVMLTGEENAIQLGVNVEMVKKKVILASTLITAAIISVTGIIGFVGLVVPHVVRLLTGPKHKKLMPVSLVVGGAFLIICDTVARSLVAQEIPVGIITAVCGGPFFLYLLRKTKKGGAFA